jgi:hypothetical protein
MRIMEQLGFFFALGVVIVFIAAAAFGRILSVPSGIRSALLGVPPRARLGSPPDHPDAGSAVPFAWLAGEACQRPWRRAR